MGFPLVEAENMPDAAAGATPIAFGDFARGYLIVDRAGVRAADHPATPRARALRADQGRLGLRPAVRLLRHPELPGLVREPAG